MQPLEIEQPKKLEGEEMDMYHLDLNALEEACKWKDPDSIPPAQINLLCQVLKKTQNSTHPTRETLDSSRSKPNFSIHHTRSKETKKLVKEDKIWGRKPNCQRIQELGELLRDSRKYSNIYDLMHLTP